VRVANRRVGLFAAAFVALSGYLVRYSQEARAYGLITLLAAVALWAVTQLVAEPVGADATPWRRRPTRGSRRPLTWTDLAWPAYGIAVGLSMHLHNTAVGIPLASNLAVGLWWLTTRPPPPHFARNWIGANLLAVAVWSPWLPGFLTQLGLVQANFWVQQPTVSFGDPGSRCALRRLRRVGLRSVGGTVVPRAGSDAGSGDHVVGLPPSVTAAPAGAVVVRAGSARLRTRVQPPPTGVPVTHPALDPARRCGAARTRLGPGRPSAG
jgi:hypothetical protein